MQEKILIELESRDEDMSGFQFVLRAMFVNPGKGDLRCYMHCIKIKDGQIIGTDGKRAHTYTAIETYHDGFYRVLKRLKTHIILLKVSETDYKSGGYPETDKFFALDENDQIAIDADLFDHMYIKSYCEIIRKMPIYQTISPEQVKDINGSFKAFIRKESVLFVGDDRKAYLMVSQDSGHND